MGSRDISAADVHRDRLWEILRLLPGARQPASNVKSPSTLWLYDMPICQTACIRNCTGRGKGIEQEQDNKLHDFAFI